MLTAPKHIKLYKAVIGIKWILSNEESCKHQTYKKIIPSDKGTIVLCGECNQQLDNGGLFEN